MAFLAGWLEIKSGLSGRLSYCDSLYFNIMSGDKPPTFVEFQLGHLVGLSFGTYIREFVFLCLKSPTGDPNFTIH
jgi:hypothetical protein